CFLFINRESSSFARSQIEQKIRSFVNVTLANSNISIRTLSIHMGYHNTTISDWITGKHSFALESLLILMYCVNLTIEEFLTADLNKIKITDLRTAPVELFKKRDTRRKMTIERIGEELKTVINAEFPPPRLSDVAKKIGYASVSSLSERFPEECRIISNRYKDYDLQNNRKNNEFLEVELEK